MKASVAAALALAMLSYAPLNAEPAGSSLDAPLATQSAPMTIELDAREAPLGRAYAHMTIPVRPGPFTIDYPEWIPGEHAPSGPLGSISELKISANGRAVPWRRDAVDMYAFHFDAPSDAATVKVDFTVLLNPNEQLLATRNIMVGNWNRYLLYQRNIDNEQYYVQPALILPTGWDYASALPVQSRSGDRVQFKTVTLETLVDSTTDMGRFVRHIQTWSDGQASAYLDLFADAPGDLVITDDIINAYKRLVPEAIAFYGGRHWNVYHAELTLSDAIGFRGIEHHQSSDDSAGDEFLTNHNQQAAFGDLVPHELSHSWNGKYWRPVGLQEPNFNTPYPELTELLWQYEGMNQYVGDMLSFRAGIRNPSDYPEYLAYLFARMSYEPGRDTTPLSDTTIGAPYYFCCGSGQYPSLRRTGSDFYVEGELVWLDVDTIIRQSTHDSKSLDDYAKLFAAGTGAPKVVTYTRADIELNLDSIVPYDWHGFFDRYVYAIAPVPPTDELERSGYRFVLNATPNRYMDTRFALMHTVDSWYSAGIQLGQDGAVKDVRRGSAAWNAGLAPGMHIVAVEGQQFSPSVWSSAIADATTSSAPIELFVKQGTYFDRIELSYHGGPKFPHLERIPGTTDMLGDIMRPHASK